jgi:transcription initiation factor TFIIH subunit 2
MADSDQDYIASSGDEAGNYLNGKKRPEKAGRSKDQTATDSRQNAEGTYVWEGEFERTWDLVQEDEEGSLTGVVAGLVQSGKRKRCASRKLFLIQIIKRHNSLTARHHSTSYSGRRYE